MTTAMEALDNSNLGAFIVLGLMLFALVFVGSFMKILEFLQKRGEKKRREVEQARALRALNTRHWEENEFVRRLRYPSMCGERESASRSFSGGSAGRDLNLVSPAKCKIEFEGRELDFVVFKDKGQIYFMN